MARSGWKVMTGTLATLGALAFGVPAAGAYTIGVDVQGAGTVTETTDAHLVACSSSESTPSSVVGAHCNATGYGWGWVVELRATPPNPGWTFVGWESGDITCDAGPASPTCRFQLWGDRSIRAVFRDIAPPDTTLSGVYGPVAEAHFTLGGFDGYLVPVTFRCRLDAGAWVPCAGSQTVGGLPDGAHTFAAAAIDPSGNMDPTPATVSFVVDRTAPQAALSAPAPFTPTGTVGLSWTAADANGLAPGVLHDRAAAWNAPFGTALDTTVAVTQTTATGSLAAGSTHCYSLTAVDRAGNRTTTPESCSAAPLDDRAAGVTATGTWKAASVAGAFQGTVLRATAKGATLSLAGAYAHRIGILATTCAACGQVQLLWNGVVYATVSLRSAATKHAVQLVGPALAGAQTGTLGVRVASAGKKVEVDGLLVSAV